MSAVSLILLTGAMSSCSSGFLSKGDKAENISQTGPTVSFARFDPSTVEMNGALQALKPAEILADVKDFNSKVTDVKAQFTNVPIEIAMQNIGGTTWRGELTTEQLQMLAVSGKTIKYDANIIAKDDHGVSVQTQKSFEVAIKAPDLARASG